MQSRFYTIGNRFGQFTSCGATALFLWSLCPQSGHAQQAVPPTPTTTSQKPPGAFFLFGDSLEAVRKGRLFYAVSPRSEQDLERLGVTSAPFSITFPLEVDRANNNVFVSARIEGRKFRLLLDTAGGPGIVLHGATAEGLKLQDAHSTTLFGSQGGETATEGLAHRMTLGRLTLGAIGVVVRRDPAYKNTTLSASTLGTEIFGRYRMTLDFGANTMTLSRGGAPVTAVTGGASLAVPFRSEQGNVLIPIHVANQPAWALVDSGSDTNVLSLSTARIAAAQVPSTWSASRVLSGKIGTGSTDKIFTLFGFKVPVPISINTSQADARHDGFGFGTTSYLGMSYIEDELDQFYRVPIGVLLGLPFLLQFRRVIIDYPNQMLILQEPQHGADVNRMVSAPGPRPGKPWPGYQWQRVGDGWLEALDQNAALPAAH